MRKDLEETIDPGQPALVVTYGNTNRRRRALDRDLFVLGRSPSCDLSLVSPEVAPVHCVLFRSGGSWLVRDCSSRPGTRVNGKLIQEIPLYDTDALQVGTFSFQLHLPVEPEHSGQAEAVRTRTPGGAGPLADELEHLRRSRRRLGELALDLRRQLQEQQARQEAEREHPQHGINTEELKRQVEQLHQRQQDFDERVAQLEEDEKSLIETRKSIDRDSDALQAMRTRCERDLTKARQEADAEIRARWEQFQQRCRQAEEEHQRTLSALQVSAPAPAPAPTASPIPQPEEAQKLDRRSEELSSYARHLRRARQQLQDRQHLDAEVTRLRTALAALEAAAKVEVPVAQAMPDQRVELTGLERENERLRQENEDLRRRLEASRLEASRVEAPRVDSDLKTKIINMEGQMAALRKQASLAAAAEEEQRNRLVGMEKELHDRDSLIVQLHARLNNRGVFDTATFNSLEAELIMNRRELERDRRALTDQLNQMQVRQAELLDAARETELQMSRERAQLARERVELTRLREEVRVQQERKQRDGTTRDRLAGLRNQQQGDTVVDGKVEKAAKPPRLTSTRKRTGPST